MTQFTTTESEPEHSAPDSGPPPDSETEDDSPEGPAGASTPRLGGSAPKLVVSSPRSGSANRMADEVRHCTAYIAWACEEFSAHDRGD